MNLRENIKEGIRAVRDNLLRSILTALIIAIGITALVGILTAIDGIQASVDDSFADLGANSFEIKVKRSRGRRRGPLRREDKNYAPISYRQVNRYKRELDAKARVSIFTYVTSIAEIKAGSKKTNPNCVIVGGNEHFLSSEGLDLKEGRNFSNVELTRGTPVCIIGDDLSETLFEKQNPINRFVQFRGRRYIVMGVLKKAGSSFGGSSKDRFMIVPLENGRLLSNTSEPTYNITTILDNTDNFQGTIGEATSLMRKIRKDPLGQPNSFEIEKSETLADRLSKITGYLRIGGFIVGFVTLLGAAIGLMNIMLVSVTERTREIGVRKALGATPYRIRQQFLIEAIVICQIGGIAGTFLGILVGNLLGLYFGLQGFIFPWMSIITGLVVCLVVGLISGYYPAYKASKLDPIESLRFE